MSFVRTRPLGLRAKLALWSTLVLAASLAAGFLWVHAGLESVLAAKNDAFLAQKLVELLAVERDEGSGGPEEFLAEIHREAEAYEAAGLVVIVRSPGNVLVAPRSELGARLADDLTRDRPEKVPATIVSGGYRERFRVVGVPLDRPGQRLELGLSLRETESTILQFDRRVATGGLIFLLLAALGGRFLSRLALRPMARIVRTARGLKPENLSARLPRTGAGDELDELAETFNDLLDRLASYHAQVIRFTADASHELRSPLAAMRAATEVALARPRDAAEYRETLTSLGEQCDRLTLLVNGLLLLARADAGEVPLRREMLELGALARDVCETFEPLFEEKDVRILVEAEGPLTVQGDPQRLRQLVTNLLDNALRFTEPGGFVSARVESDGDSARLSVRDSGIGIPDVHLPHVFERFYQVDPARSSEGCGLGLSICRWIVEAHGGTIRANSVQPRGIEFLVNLPRIHDAVESTRTQLIASDR